MRKEIDVKKLKSKLTLKDYKNIMKSLDIPLYNESPESIIYWSGDKNKNALMGSPKLYFYKDTKIFVSYTSARSYDIISLVETRLNLLGQKIGFFEAIQFILSIAGLADEEILRVNNNKYKYDWEESLGKYIRFRREGTVLPIYDKTILSQLEQCYPESWINEGISIETMQKYHIGYYRRNNCTTIPCFDKAGNLCGIRVRNWQEEDLKNKRKYMPLILLDDEKKFNFPTNNVFYGINYNAPEIERRGHVILVEGEKSVLKADTFWKEKSNVLALYGSQIGAIRRNELIKMGVTHVTLALDSDFHEIGDNEFKEFEQKILNLGKLFKGYCEVDVIYNNIGLTDGYKTSPFDYDEAVFNKLWENREFL